MHTCIHSGVIMHTIGFVPGAMKPFHAGHNHLIQKAIAECDKVIVFTSLKDRGIIKGDNMYKAWQEIIVPLLPNHVEVIGVRSPVGAVYDISNGMVMHLHRIEYTVAPKTSLGYLTHVCYNTIQNSPR